jgi:hypothetical protein
MTPNSHGRPLPVALRSGGVGVPRGHEVTKPSRCCRDRGTRACEPSAVDCGAGRGEQVRDLWFAEGVALCLLLLESAVRAGQPALVLAEVLRPGADEVGLDEAAPARSPARLLALLALALALGVRAVLTMDAQLRPCRSTFTSSGRTPSRSASICTRRRSR